MQYTVAHIAYNGEPWQRDLIEQALCDIGFETFDGDDAYIQTALFDTEALRATLADYEHVQLLGVEDCPDENWNATWEAEHPVEELPLAVRIVPHCAFGAGHHETTGMMIAALLTQDLTGKSVLDNGSGTGVLGIMAAKRGAASVIAVDIDDKSVESTRDNAELNQVAIDARLGCEPAPGEYDLILANIHRNILLAQMADYARYLRPNGQLWISGFYEDDIAPLREEAERQGLQFLQTNANGEWRMCQFTKSEL